MNSFKKRMATLVLCLTMIFSIFAFSANAKVYSGICGKDGDNVNWTVDSKTNTLTISGTGEMRDFGYKTPWDFSNINCVIYTAIIEDGVTNISSGAFDFGDDTRIFIIGKDVARIDSSLQSYNIKSITVSEDNAHFCSVADVLYNKEKTELIRYPVSSERFTTFRIPEGIRRIHSYAFEGSRHLEEVVIPASVEEIGSRAFSVLSECPLKKFTVIEGNSRYSSDSQGALYDQREKSLIKYPAKSDARNYTVADGTEHILSRAFYECSNLSRIVFPEGLISLDSYAIYYCENISYIHIPKTVQVIDDNAIKNTNGFICCETEDCYAKQFAQENNLRFRTCSGHGGSGDAFVVSLQPVVDPLGPIIGKTSIYTNNFPMWSMQKVQINISDDDIQAVEYASSDKSIIRVTRTVENGCLVRTGRSGTATITCTVTDSKGNTATDTCEITVKHVPIVYWILHILRVHGWIDS